MKKIRNLKIQKILTLNLILKIKKFFFERMEICNQSESCNLFKEYSLKGSNNDSDWITIESWNRDLPKPNTTWRAWTYNTTHPNGFYRYLKLEINGLNTSNNYRFCLKKIELYGVYQQNDIE